MSHVKTSRTSLHAAGMPRSPSSSSIASSTRPRRININLPKHEATAAAFVSSATGASTLTEELVAQERARYTTLVAKNATSEALMKMPNVATKPESVERDVEQPTVRQGIACKLPRVSPAQMSNLKVVVEDTVPMAFPSGYQVQRPASGRTRSASSFSFQSNVDLSNDNDEMSTLSAKRTSMNPHAASFTPSFAKSGGSDCAVSDYSGQHSNRPSRRSTVDSSRDAAIAGLGISSPTTDGSHQGLTVNTKAQSPSAMMRQDRSTFGGSELSSPLPISAVPADFNPEEFRINLMRQISDKLETGLDRHFSQLVSATAAALPLSPATSDHDGGSGGSTADDTAHQLKKLLRNATAELERVKLKNQELRETNHKLELQHMEATHQVARLQDFELNNQFLLSRVKELESCASSVDSVETSSMNGHRHQRHSSTTGNMTQQSQHIQRLMREVASLTSERDALKIRSWELEKKPYAQQHQQRPAHFVDLENERNRLVEELGAKTVAMEDLWNKNETLMVRATEYEKRVWELEGQCAALEEECKALPTIRSDLVEMEARAVAADALVEKMQDMEGQVALVKNFQDRIQELETTNAVLDHSNWDLSERLNIANNQHALLTKEFESFRSKDKDDRRVEILATRNRELEALLAEQAKISPDYKDEYERVSAELEKIKIRLPQLEGQSKQVALLRSKNLQLEKQIKTMEELEPRLEEMNQLHERNLFLEGELGELENLRAREMELEGELEETKSRLNQLETSKSRMASFSGLKQAPGSRARSGSVAQHSPSLFQEGEENASGSNLRSGSPVQQQPQSTIQPLSRRTSQSASAWPSGRSSMSLSRNRVSTSSNASSTTALTNGIRASSPRGSDEETITEKQISAEPLSMGSEDEAALSTAATTTDTTH
ncbi:hypothetical protein KVV02_004210 [Mortierella alpina]|uniref:Uncharacterized protein n=1 Tax=Mortierella alpina TaxID=64518 RepID=A0A9P8A0D6_MORAP|nr:hypothetical protein KVV02_004210 [Mortierella alpina]